MIITRKSMFTGITYTMDLPITQGELDSVQPGELGRRARPSCLTLQQHEFITTGAPSDEWDRFFEKHTPNLTE